MTVAHAVFIILALVTLGGAWGVVSARSVFISALFLIMALVGVAGLYVLLEAGFLAAVQLLIYVGAIAVLILFVIMLTRRVMAEDTSLINEQWGLAGTITGLLFALLAVLVVGAEWRISDASPPADPIVGLGQALLGPYVLPFEIASLVLLVALIGAIIIARE
jgi:NADH-quinone oxidoreductase subunit J